MKRRILSSYFYFLSLLIMIGFIYFHIQGYYSFEGWMLTGFFISIALAFRCSSVLKGFSYTLIILAAVSLAMYFPSYFQKLGTLKLSSLILPLLQIIMFGMG